MRITRIDGNVTTEGGVTEIMTCILEYLALQFEELDFNQREDAMEKTLAVLATDTSDDSVILDDIGDVTLDFDIQPDEEEWTYSIDGADLTNIEVISVLGQALHYAFAMQGTAEHDLIRCYNNFFNVLHTAIVEDHYIRREAMKKAQEEHERLEKEMRQKEKEAEARLKKEEAEARQKAREELAEEAEEELESEEENE